MHFVIGSPFNFCAVPLAAPAIKGKNLINSFLAVPLAFVIIYLGTSLTGSDLFGSTLMQVV
jgi:hypothetical protein